MFDELLTTGLGVGDKVGVVTAGISVSKVGAGDSVSKAAIDCVGKGVAVAFNVIVGKGVRVETGVAVSLSSSSGSSGGSVALGSYESLGSTAPAIALSCLVKFNATLGT